MGMQQSVSFAGKSVPAWLGVRDLLVGLRYPVQMRMIDNELAFPDEEPGDTWRELRLGAPEGMVTVRREGDRLVLLVWGNADDGLQQAWNALAWAFAEAGGGQIETPQGLLDASTFRQQAALPAALRP
jgi:hypothetical protein